MQYEDTFLYQKALFRGKNYTYFSHKYMNIIKALLQSINGTMLLNKLYAFGINNYLR
jgi:hypothetical protein